MKAILALSAAVAFVMSPFLSTGFNGFRPDQFPIPQIDPPRNPQAMPFRSGGWFI